MENVQKLHRLTKLLHDHVVKYPENDEDRESYPHREEMYAYCI